MNFYKTIYSFIALYRSRTYNLILALLCFLLFALDSHAQTNEATGYGGISGVVKLTRPSRLSLTQFGSSIANLGDLDGDLIDDLAVGTQGFSLDSGDGFHIGGVFILLMNADETIKPTNPPRRLHITDGSGGIELGRQDFFGVSVANIGDFSGNGINELAVGTLNGRIYLIRLFSSLSVRDFTTIDIDDINNMLDVDSVLNNTFGVSIANLGDIDNDGVIDLAVGAHRGDGGNRGSVHILFMEKTGTGENIRPGLKSVVKLDTTGLNLANNDSFGISVANIGDLNGDGINDLAVGAIGDDEHANDAGAVHIFHLGRDGSVKLGGFKIFDDAFNAGDAAGRSITNLGDINGDGINDIAVGAVGADSPSIDNNTGAVFTIFMGKTRDQITTNDFFRIDSNSHADLNLRNGDSFGQAIANIGDRNGDGLNDIAVGAPFTNESDFLPDQGAFYIMYMGVDSVVTEIRVEAADGSYTTNDTIDIQVIFSAVVNVDTTEGRPTLTLETRTGDDDTDAVYDSGSGSDTLTFVYTVAGGDSVRDLDYKSTASITLNDGTINNTTGERVATLTLPEPGTRGSISSQKNISINQEALTNRAPRPIIEPIPTLELTAVTSFTYPIAYVDDENDLLTYAIDESTLPRWLRFDADTGTFSGTAPASPRDLTTYTFTVSDGEFTPTGMIGIIVNSQLRFSPPLIADINYSPGNQRFIIQLPIINEGGTSPITYTLSPPLPAGSTFDGGTRRIMITPTAEQTEQYTYTAEDKNGALATQIFAINISATREISDIVKYDHETVPGLLAGTAFGSSVANLGDIDENGTDDLAVGAPLDDSEGSDRGAVYILLLDVGSTIKASTKIIHGSAGINLIDDSNFGTSVANIGDFNDDGINELAVGTVRGDIYILRLTRSGEIELFSTIDVEDVNNPIRVTSNSAELGSSIANIGDIDGDGVDDLAVGSIRDGTGGMSRGAVHILFMNESGLTKKANAKIRHPDVTLTDFDAFGSSIANLGDLDGDGINDIAVGAIADDKASGNTNEGAVHILLLNRDGSIKPTSFEIVDTGNDTIFNPDTQDFTGASIANLGDINGDGINDIAVGAPGNNNIPSKEGSVFTILMRNAGDDLITTNGFFRIDTNSHSDLNLSGSDRFGAAIANIGDRNEDGVNDLAVGAPGTDSGGALYLLYMDANTRIVNVTSSAANGSYGPEGAIDIGAIDIQVIFSERVNVDTSRGVPRLTLETGSIDTQAIYLSGSGSTRTFRYFIETSDRATDLDYDSTASLTLNGATINASAAPNREVVLTLPEPGTRGSLSSNKNISINTDAIINTPPTRDLTIPIPAQVLTVNTSFTYTIPAGAFTDAENDPLRYSPVTTLPNGLTLDATGTFSGTPVTEQTSTQQYTFLVSDDTASTNSTIGIKVNAALTLPTIADRNYSPGILISETLPLVIEGTGTKPIKYTLSPTLVDGLITFDAGERTITGTAPAAEQRRQYTYTAEDKNGALAAQIFTLIITSLELPNISDKTYSLGNTINEMLPLATGGTGALAYTLTPALADGLTFSTATRAISGTPERLSRSEYTYTATDALGSMEERNFFITIIAEAISPFPVMDAETVIRGVTAEEENGSYNTDDTINIQVIFSEAVDVDATEGTPTLSLETGGTLIRQ